MASIEEDTLKVLQRIEIILGKGSTASGLGRKPTVAGGRNDNDNDGGGTSGRRNDLNNRKAYRATAAALSGLAESTNVLNRSFLGLNKTVLNTRANFSAMNRSMRSFANDAPVSQPVGGQERLPPVPRPDADREKRSKSKLDPWKNMPKFIQDIRTGFNDTMGEFQKKTKPSRVNKAAEESTKAASDAPCVNLCDEKKKAPVDLAKKVNLDKKVGAEAERTGGKLAGLGGKVAGAAAAIGGFIVALSAALIPVTRDILMLHSAGIQASSALGGMYIDAARAGMSLKDYTTVLQNSSAAVTRAGSMAEFNDTLQVANNRLMDLGIFGAEATKLSASLANSTTALGVPQENMRDAILSQVSTFESLRKSSLMTAESFQKLTEELADNQTVQSQLLGMGPAQRAARFNELTAIKTIGLSMGSTKKASDALGEALIAQRNLTAPKRFESAGLVRQAGAMFGQDASATETLARLSRKKNLTEEESRTATRLGAQLQAGIERELNSGDISRENRAEVMQERLNSAGIGKFLQAAGNVGLTAESGQAGVNKDFAKGTSDLLKATGMLFAWADGLKENTIVKALGSALPLAIGAGLARAFGLLGGGAAGGGILSSIGGMISGAFGAIRSGVGAIFGFIGSTFSRALSWIPGLLNTVTRAGGIIGSIGATIGGWVTSVGNAFRSVGALFGSGGAAVGGFLRKIPIIGTVIGVAIDGLGELITNNITAAFNPSGSGGFVEVIGNAIFGIFNGFMGSIGKLMDGIVGMFTDDGFHFENALNVFGVFMKAGFMQLLGNVASGFGLGENKLSKYFHQSAEDSFAVMDKLLADNTSTVSSIGKENNKEIDSKKKTAAATKELAEKTEASNTKLTAANAGIITSTSNITAGIMQTAASIATPVQPTVNNVTPPAVNKENIVTPETPAETTRVADGTILPTDAIVAQLVSMTALLSSMLTAEQMQAAGIGALAAAAGRPVFLDNETKYDLLQGNRYRA